MAELAAETREFLFALAYWVATADHVLQETERQWLDEHFGERLAADMMGRLSSLQPSRLGAEVKRLYLQIPPDELHCVAASIRPWLRDLMLVDGERAVNEVLVGSIVTKLLGLNAQRKAKHSGLPDLRPFKGWPNPVATISRSSFEMH